MRRWAALAPIFACATGALGALLSAQCGSSDSADDETVPLPGRVDGGEDGSSSTDATPPSDAPSAACDPSKPFGPPSRLTEFDAPTMRSTPRLSADELTIYFTTRGDGSAADLTMATRASTSAPFSNEKTMPQSSLSNDNDPSVGADHLTLWFHSGRNGTSDIFLATRSSTSVPFGDASTLPTIDSPLTNENHAYFRAAANELWFISDRPAADGGFDIYTSVRDGGVFAAPTRVAELSSASSDYQPQPSEDGLTLLLASDRPGGKGKLDLFIARRSSPSAKFSAPAPITELNTAFSEQAGWLSADGCRIWFSSGRDTADDHQQLFSAVRPK